MTVFVCRKLQMDS